MKKWLLLSFATLLLTGCWDVTEPERMYYALGIGVDYADEKYIAHVQIIDFTNVAKSEQPQPDATQAEVGIGRGETLDEAIFDLYHSLDMRLFWGHLSFVVLSDSALQDGRLDAVINTLTRYRETRYRIWVYGTKDKISDVMLTTPVLNKAITLSSMATPLNSFSQESYIPPVNFRQLILRLNEPSYTAGIPYLELTENWETENGKREKVNYKGMAVISRKELIGILPGEDIKGTQFMTNDTIRTQITYFLKEKPLTMVVRDIKVDVEPKFVQKSFRFDITVKFKAIASDFHAEVTKKEIADSLEKEVEKRIKETYEKALEQGIDIYRLSNYAYKKNVKGWKKVEENGQVALDEESISSIDVSVEKISAARKEYTKTIKAE